HLVGDKGARRIEPAFGDDALAFAKKIRQLPGIDDRHRLDLVGDDEPDRQALAANEASRLDQAAEANALSAADVLFSDLARRIEEDDRVAERKEDEAGRHRQG